MVFVSSSALRRYFGHLVTCTLALGIAGCGDDGEGLPGVPIEQFSQEFRGAQCERLVRCNLSPDLTACEASIPTDPGVAQAVAAVTAGDLVYDPNAGRACIDAVRGYQCEGDYFLPRSLRETCDTVFTNRKGEGEPCFQASECQGLDAVCEGSSSDACTQGSCKLAGGTSGVGAACSDTQPCAPDLICRNDPMSGMPTCAQKFGPGETCGSPYECITGYGCDPNTNTCFKQAASGAQCNPDLAAPGCAAVGEYCDMEKKQCLPLPGDGKACVTNAFLTNACAPWALCTGEGATCVRMPAAGEPCNMGYCIGLLECGGGTCEALAPSPTCSL
jgi:hypothetical protein